MSEIAVTSKGLSRIFFGSPYVCGTRTTCCFRQLRDVSRNVVTECALIIIAAFMLDYVFGDPRYPFHPARLIGQAIFSIEKAFRSLRFSGILGGGLLVIIVLWLSLGAYWSLRFFFGLLCGSMAVGFDVFIVYSAIALRDMSNHARPIVRALDKEDIAGARKALQKIVGRDTATLDASGVARAAIESVSENFLDGFFSPLCWYVLGAGCALLLDQPCLVWAVSALLAYRVVNTLDSMIGYRNERYLYFGRVSARLDDIMNFVPARLVIPVLFLAAAACRLRAQHGLRTALRDRLKHASPNAGHAESFTAGALSVKLGGPVRYPHRIANRPWIGAGSPEATSAQVIASCRLVMCAGWISLVLSLAIMLVPENCFFVSAMFGIAMSTDNFSYYLLYLIAMCFIQP